MKQYERYASLKDKQKELEKILEPITNPVTFNSEAYSNLMSYEINKYLNEHPEADNYFEETII